jgi:DNA ligase-1
MKKELQVLFNSRSIKEKKTALKELSGNKDFSSLISTYYPIDFGVSITKNKAKKVVASCLDSEKVDLAKVRDFLQSLYTAKGRNLKASYLKRIPHLFTKVEADLLIRLINKDLGVSYRTLAQFIDSLPYYPFQLAEQAKSSTFSKLLSETEENKKVIIQPKLDGIRIHYNPSKGEFYTRNQERITTKERPNLRVIEDTVAKVIERIPELEGYILDGELFAGDWNTTMTLFQTEDLLDEEKQEKLCFYVYDLIPKSDYESYRPKDKNKVVTEVPYIERAEVLRKVANLTQPAGTTRFGISTTQTRNLLVLLPVVEEVIDLLDVYSLLTKFTSAGFEGLMVKSTHYPYLDDRTHHWLKVKPSNEIDAEVVEILEGEGKHQGKLGAILCKAKIGNKEVLFRVGSGFTDSQREYFFENPEEIVGKIVEVQYQELTKDKIPRFPVFKRIRKDKREVE